jgi:drug/metabolite transporter (DMT)-like permease
VLVVRDNGAFATVLCGITKGFCGKKISKYTAQLYPLTQGASLILSAGMAAVFFGEKITVRVIVGCVTCFAGLLLLNLL